MGNGETVETVADFILGGSKITADGDCSHEIIIYSKCNREICKYFEQKTYLCFRKITLVTS